MEVPLMVLMAVSLSHQAEVMLPPGAKRSRQLPVLEKEERLSSRWQPGSLCCSGNFDAWVGLAAGSAAMGSSMQHDWNL
jgi:hypothetical protein